MFKNQAKVIYTKLMDYIRGFLKGCQICQLHKVGPVPEYSMTKFSCYIKHMYRTNTGHSFILVVTDNVTTYLVTIPLYKGTSHEIADELLNYLSHKHHPYVFLI